MKSALKWTCAGLLVYIIFLIVKLPAALVVSQLELPKDIKIMGVSGTIWQGQAQRISYKGLPVYNLEWSLAFFPLLLQKINADIHAGNLRDKDQVSLDAQLSVSKQGIQGQDILAYLPTELVMSQLTLPIPVHADGRFKVQLKTLDYQAGCQTIEGKGQWLNASYTGTTGDINLGNFDGNISCQGGNIALDVKAPNSFGLTATVIIPANLKYSVQGRFKPDAQLPREVHQAAKFFGNVDANGYYPIKL